MVRPVLAGTRQTIEQVKNQIYDLIRQGQLRPGDRLPPEREFAKQLRLSRNSLRAGLRALIEMGILRARQGDGTYVAAGPPALQSDHLRVLVDLHGLSLDEIFEARETLEITLTGLAAERATDQHLATLAEEVANMYAMIDDPEQFLQHDIQFHQTIAAAGQSQVLSAVLEMVSGLHYEQRKIANKRATNLRESAQAHQRIYQAIRQRQPELARTLMHEHIVQAKITHEETLHLARKKKALR
jgi:GntR family transcriptional regulator, transcriptional repressor for pyruvate dehydrogenase complex